MKNNGKRQVRRRKSFLRFNRCAITIYSYSLMVTQAVFFHSAMSMPKPNAGQTKL